MDAVVPPRLHDRRQPQLGHIPPRRVGQPDGDFVIFEQATGRFPGAVGVNQINRVHDFANLGYWIRSSATGHGTAVLAVRLCARFGFEELKLRRLEIVVDVDNPRSQRVAEKVGATREGIARQRCKYGNAWHDAVMFSLVPTDLDFAPTFVQAISRFLLTSLLP